MSKEVDLDFFIDGMIYCAENAKKLSEDARRLYRVRRYSTAGMLAISSLEESGKVYLLQILTAMYIKRKELNMQKGEYWKFFHKMWRDHRLKQICASWIDLLLFDKEAIRLARHSMLNGDLFGYRNQFLYVDLINGQWKMPKKSDRNKIVEFIQRSEIVSQEIVKEFNTRRREALKQEMFDPREIEIMSERRNEIINLLYEEGFSNEDRETDRP